MKVIRVSDATWRTIAEMAILPFHSTATRQPDGTWLVQIEDDTWERLEQHRLAGESDDDVLTRALRAARGDKPS